LHCNELLDGPTSEEVLPRGVRLWLFAVLVEVALAVTFKPQRTGEDNVEVVIGRHNGSPSKPTHFEIYTLVVALIATSTEPSDGIMRGAQPYNLGDLLPVLSSYPGLDFGAGDRPLFHISTHV